MHKMRSKRGFLLGEYTLKVIVSVICLLLLFYLLFRMYSSYMDAKNLDMAKATLNELEGKMNLAKDSVTVQEFALLNPKVPLGYWKKGEKAPLGCLGNCLCFCIGNSFSWSLNILTPGRIVKCNSPVCKSFDDEVIINDGSIWGIPKDIKIGYKDNKYYLIEVKK
jgi:hypothetical protein